VARADSPAGFQKDRIEQPTMPGAYLNPSIPGEITDGPRIRLSDGEWLLDIDVRVIPERDARQRKMSCRRRQQVDDSGLCLPQHGIGVAIATGNGMARSRLTRPALVRIAHSHDLHIRQRLERCNVMSADPAAADKGDPDVLVLACAHSGRLLLFDTIPPTCS
jgi:hypothetical protein